VGSRERPPYGAGKEGSEMIIGLAGYAQSGKDTVARYLVENYGFTRIAFADKIREFVYEVDPLVWGNSHTGGQTIRDMVDEFGWDVAKQHAEVRRILQRTGVAARDVFGKDFWVNAALADAHKGAKYVITDVRFKNEADAINDRDGQLVRVIRPGVEAVNGHISEHDLDDYDFDRVIKNQGTVADLELLVETMVNDL
jgi:hypothetical protein